MLLRFLVLTFGLMLLILGLFGAAATEPRADLTYVNPSDIHSLDPARISWTQDIRVALNLWEGLTIWHPRSLEPQEGAAAFPPDVRGDGLSYTFRIRGDTRWSNGDAVTAADFVRGWRRAMEPGTAADYLYLFTEHLAGAGEYARWRQDGVTLLTALSRLVQGWRIDARQARAIGLRWDELRPWAGIHGGHSDERPRGVKPAAPSGLTITKNDSGAHNHQGVPRIPQEDARDDTWLEWVSELTSAGVDWKAVHARAHYRHAAEMDEQFSRVGIAAPQPDVLHVTLARPCPYFLDLTSFVTFVPIHRSIEALRERYAGRAINEQGLVVFDPQWTKPDYRRNGYGGLVTNGPYRLGEWIFKRRARLVMNPYSPHADVMPCRTVDMLVFGNVSASLMAYETGTVDLLTDLNVPYAHELARLSLTGHRPDFHSCAVAATYFLTFNCMDSHVDGGRNPFVDARVRKALSLVVDREEIVSRVRARGDRVAHSFVPPDTMAGYTPPRGLRRDVETARKLLLEAGYRSGADLPPVRFLFTPNDSRLCQAIAHMWSRDLGIVVELQAKESKSFAEDKARRRFMVARSNWYTDYGDPTTFLNCLVSGDGNNDGGYASPAYDALLAEAADTRDMKLRHELLARAEALVLTQDCPILPILHYNELIAMKPYVSGVHPNARLWFPFRYARVDRP